jgi:hypothetical protein
MIEPLPVVDQADQRLPFSDGGHQAQHGQAHQEPVRRGPGTHAERGPQSFPLRPRHRLQPIQHRTAQLMQPGEGQLHLRLDTGGPLDAAARHAPAQVLQQRCLAHTRLAMHHQRPALAGADSLHQPVKHPALGVAAGQLRRAARHRQIPRAMLDGCHGTSGIERRASAARRLHCQRPVSLPVNRSLQLPASCNASADG